MTHLAVPIAAETLDEANRQIRRAVASGAEILEFRTDYLKDLSPDLIGPLVGDVRGRIPPGVAVIVTCRDPREGGAGSGPESLRVDVLVAAIEIGADLVDFECANFQKPANAEAINRALSNRPKCRLILSAHEFTGTFGNLRRLHGDILEACPDAIPKLVYTANHINDCFEAFDLLHETSGDRIVLCMGEAGLIGRLLAAKLGGFVTFASLDEQVATAPGQLTAKAVKGLYRYDAIDSDTELFGVIADPVAHSLSPAIHNACLGAAGINGLYFPLLVQGGRPGFDAFLDNVLARPWLDFRGLSVTIPHKHNALEYVRREGGYIDPLTEKIGAANTLVIERQAASGGRRLSAYNTDYTGALEAITTGMGIEREDLRNVPVAVVGAGGVARAIVAGLTDAGAKVTIYNRTVERAAALAAEFGARSAGLDALAGLDAQLLVNGTSIGMHPNVDASCVPAEVLKPGMAVFDTVYNPAETRLLKQAKQAGAKTIDGIAMFVSQAAAQFHLFTGQTANTDLMRNVVLDGLR